MTKSLSKTTLIGNMGDDPEIRFNQAGNPMATFTIATGKKWRDKNTGEPREHTEWHKCVAFGPVAQAVADYMSKGSKVYVEGENRTKHYEKDGVKRYVTEIAVRDVIFLDSIRPEVRQQHAAPEIPPEPAAHVNPATGRVQAGPPGGDDLIDDVPF